MKSDWFVQPDALMNARLERMLGQAELAQKSGVSLRSIQGYERNEQRIRLESLQCLAKALAVEVKAIGKVHAVAGAREAKAKAAASAPPSPAAPPSVLPPRTPLETLVDLERGAGVEAGAIETAEGPIETLTTKRLQDVLTAYALYEGRLFALTGKVEGMRGIAQAEAALLGSRNGIAARFHIVREVIPGQPVGVTVHTATAKHTEALQKSYGDAPVTLHLRVVLVPGEPNEEGPGFSSFITRLTTKRLWTFVVVEVEGAGVKAPAPAKKGRKRP
jgi:transcriptional regulator with XRE-family HTH domain